MAGYQEILIISAIVLGVIFIPRMMTPPQKPQPRLVRGKRRLSGAWRAVLALSAVYPLTVAAVMQPWRRDPVAFFFIGLAPVLLLWLLYWVLRGFRK